MGGLIPAHAGKTGSMGVDLSVRRAHPRSRGENMCVLCHMLVLGGSSPLTRGKPDSVCTASHSGGLIPAHAGKTRPTPVSKSKPGAHPRSRGENSKTRAEPPTWPGSSPLTRGKHVEVGHGSEGHGLIPAHAGKTPRRGHGRCPGWAHPRSRGENLPEDHPEKWAAGSSPLTRGKPPVDGAEVREHGLIPAHAGKTVSQHSDAA